jgi:selenocysteine lyase/cysteine desulfurase
MSRTADRREFLKQLAVGGAAITLGSPGGGHAPIDADGFGDRLKGARNQVERWQVVKDQFLLEPGYAYFNTAGLGPSPQPVISAFHDAWVRLEAHSETGHGEREAVREKAAAFLGCAVEEMAFTRSATEGMNLVARGLDLVDGDEVVMTTHEHPGGAMPWFGLREDVGIRIRTFEPGTGGEDTLERLTRALSPRTRVVMVSHVTCTTGLIMPLPELAELCHSRDIALVLDGAQAPGQIHVDLHALGCDFYVSSGHKWLLAPKGTGFLYVRDEWLDRWKPSYVGAYSDATYDLEAGVFRRLRPASASEYGTRSTPLIVGFGAAFDFLSTMGMEAVTARGPALARHLRAGLDELGVEILTPEGHAASILTFRLPRSGGTEGEWASRIRRDHGIRLRPVSEAGLGGVRASPHVFNTEDEVNRLLEVIQEVV